MKNRKYRGAIIISSRMISYAAAFAALYLILSYIPSLIFGSLLRGSDAHLVRAVLMAILATRFTTYGGPSLMGLISGLLLLGIPAPAAFLYFPGSLVAGVVYDASLRVGNYGKAARKRRRIILSSILAGIAESSIVTAGFFLIGFPFQEIVYRLALGGFEPGIGGIWLYSVGKNVIMSIVGGSVAIYLIPRLARHRSFS